MCIRDRSRSGSSFDGRRRRRSRGPRTVADDCEVGSDGGDLVLGDEDRLDDAREGGRDLGVDLVGRHLDERLVDGDRVTDCLLYTSRCV